MSLENNISLSAGHRNVLRSLVRSQPGFSAWRKANGFDVHLTTTVIIDAVNHFGLVAEARRILDAPAPTSTRRASVVSGEESDMDAEIVDAPQDGNDRASAIASDMDKVLSPVRDFLAGPLVAKLESALRPIVENAHKPATIIEREAPTPLREGEAPRASRVGVSTMRKTFGVGGKAGALSVALWNDVSAPRPDSGYVMDGAAMFPVASALEHGEMVWLAGSAGTGKTTRAREYAARTGRGFVRIGFTHSTELIDLIGQKEPVPSGDAGAVEMVWRDGVFIQAIRRPGTVVLLDELTASPPGTSIAFQTILDERRATLPTGEVVTFADGVVVVVADNTAGYGDESGVYAGTQAANGALVDRAARLVIVDYLPPLLEAEALEKRTGAPSAACLRLAEFAAKTRVVQAQAGGDARPFSIRRLIAFANATHRDLIGVDDAWQITTLSRLPEADRESMRQAIRAHFDSAAYKRELEPQAQAPQASQAPQSNAPSQVGARAAFDVVDADA